MKNMDTRRKCLAPITALLSLSLLLSACGQSGAPNGPDKGEAPDAPIPSVTVPEIGDKEDSFGETIKNEELYDGYTDGESDIDIKLVSGTADAYTYENGVLTFGKLGEDSIYSISGTLKGAMVIDTGDDHKFELELRGFSIISDSQVPITVLSGDEVTLCAKKDYENYIYDMRETVDSEDETLHSGAVYAETDLELSGKGSLKVVSENNNGIHTKDDLQIKNLSLYVFCRDNALKGNDSVEIESGTLTLIATAGDGIKTSNSDISEKGNQRGTVSITGGDITVYAACDGIDAAYDADILGAETSLKIYTDKYSNYSEEVTAADSSLYYIRFNYLDYKYSIKYYNSDDDYIWVDPEYHSKTDGGYTTYYYFSFPKNESYAKMQFFMYSPDMEQSRDDEYIVASELLTPSTAYDTFSLTAMGNSLRYSWTNYTTKVGTGMGRPGMGGMGGPGGMQEGNPDKGDHSAKGIKAANAVLVSEGSIIIKAYDDAIHANAESTLENGELPLGLAEISGGTVSLYSNDDGVHADGEAVISGGVLNVTSSYEGIEGYRVLISGGSVSVVSSDDGINGTATSETAIAFTGGTSYIYSGGDGIDSNSRVSYSGISFAGGSVTVISTSGGNSAIDSEQGYEYTGGKVLAIMPSGGMSSEALRCADFSSIGTRSELSASAGQTVTVRVSGEDTLTLKMPVSISGMAIYLGSPNASISVK